MPEDASIEAELAKDLFVMATDTCLLAEERLLRMSYFDGLTGVYNRSLFELTLQEAAVRCRATGKRLAVLDIDIDRFRLLNEAFGHAFGDTVLREIAQRLAVCIGLNDTLARLSSDEFGVLLTDAEDEADIDLRVQDLLRAVALAISAGNATISPSVSVGVAIFPDDGATPEALLRHAGTALARARTRNARRYERYCGSEQDARELLLMESNLRSAVARQEIAVHLQPQIDLRTGRLSGAEALVRWTDPELGPVPPDRFIPLAETTGLILPLGECVLRTAVRSWANWVQTYGLSVPVSVNLSAVQIVDGAFNDLIADVLTESVLEPALIKLELTETALLGDAIRALRTMEVIHAQGIEFALDDFGTGYSSLSHLHQFPIGLVKIDRSFVAEIPSSRTHDRIVRAVISLSHELGLAVVAEGVETEEQRDHLIEIGCDYGQGYLFDRPLPPEEFECRWLLRDPG